MIASLGDPFSAYLSPEEYRQSLEGLSGTFGGIGARIENRRLTGQGDCPKLGGGCVLAVVEPIQGAPAEKAGLKAGDIIERVDGTSLDGLTADQALAMVRGPKGTSVTLTILRGSAASFDLTIVRDAIVQKEVETKTLAGGAVGYIRLAGFSDRAAVDFVEVAADVAAGRHKLIVDLRGNPGGFVTDAQRVISQFIPAGTTIFWQEDAAHAQVPTVALAGGAATDLKIRVVVLIDGGSASASEIVAGALQDLGRAKLIGLEVLRQGHDPGLAAARRRQRRLPPDDREMAHPEQALDPPGGPHAGRPRRGCAERAAGVRSGPGQGARDPRRGLRRGAVVEWAA